MTPSVATVPMCAVFKAIVKIVPTELLDQNARIREWDMVNYNVFVVSQLKGSDGLWKEHRVGKGTTKSQSGQVKKKPWATISGGQRIKRSG